MNGKIWLVVALTAACLMGCKDSADITPPQITEKVNEQDKVENVPITQIGLSEGDIKLLEMVKSRFDAKLNEDNTRNRPLSELYKFNEKELAGSYLQKNPIATNFPYNNELPLYEFREAILATDIWSYKCGYADKEGKSILNYFCLDTNGPIFDYLKAECADNELIQGFVSDYLKAQDFTPTIQQTILLQSGEALDFENTDHQLFWAVYHLSLNETMTASKTVKKYRVNLEVEK